MSPWAPIALTIAVAVLIGGLVWRSSRDGLLVCAAVLFVLGVASVALGTIATIAFFWAALLFLLGLVAVAAALLRAHTHRN